MERQKDNDKRQLQFMKFVKEKQSKMQKELNKQREEERREREEERKEFNKKILEMQMQAEERLELLTQVIANKNSNELNQNVFSQTAIWSALETFHYVPEEDLTSEAYFRRFGDAFRIDCKSWSEQMKVRLLLEILGATEHNKFIDYLILKQTSEMSSDEAVKSLMELYCPKTSLFHKRWKCINLTRKEGQDYTTFASVVNRHCDNFGLSLLLDNNFKVLIFIQGLVSTKDAELRRQALNRLEKEPNITLQQLAEECQKIILEKQNSKNIDEAGIAHIRKL